MTLAWDPNPERDIGGYIVYYGSASRNYTNAVNVRTATTATVAGLVDGVRYFLAVTAYNTNGLESDFSDEAIFVARRPRSRLTVITNGFGTVSPDLNGSILAVGKTYELRAIPLPDKVFLGWTGGATASTKRLTFIMRSNMVLRANFGPHPFAGSYNGLFYERDEVRHHSSGLFTAELGTNASFSAKLWLAGVSYDMTGQFDAQGRAQVAVARPGTNALTLYLRLDRLAGADQITGSVGNGLWTAELLADRAIFDSIPEFGVYRGRYTCAIAGSAAPDDGPPGSGFGAVTVGRKGRVSVVGELADGQKFTQTVPLSRRGEWPFYVALYGGRGSMLGWLTFKNQATNDVAGLLNWIKPARPDARYYPLGFTNQSPVTGSRYETNRFLNQANALLAVGGGHLGEPITNAVTLVGTNLVASQGRLHLDCALDPSSGVFGGTFVVRGTGITNRLRGVVLQKQNRAEGFHRGTDQTGWLRLESAD